MADRPVLHELDDALAVGSRAPDGTTKRERSDGRGREEEPRRRPAPSVQRHAPHSAGGRPRERGKSLSARSTTSSRPGVPTTPGGADVRASAHPTPASAERRRLVAMRLMPGIVARFDGFEDELNRHARRVTLTQLWTAAIEHALPDDPDAALAL